MPGVRRPILAILFCIIAAVQVRWAISTVENLFGSLQFALPEGSRGEEYGEARLAELAALIADVDRFAGDTPQHDDLTALVLRAV